MAEHSICQPGRPSLQGLGQSAHPAWLLSREQIEWVFLPLVDFDPSADTMSSILRPDSLPYSSKVRTRNRHLLGLIGMTALDEPLDHP